MHLAKLGIRNEILREPPPFLLKGVTDFRQLIALISPVTTGFRLKTTGRSSSRVTVEGQKDSKQHILIQKQGKTL